METSDQRSLAEEDGKNCTNNLNSRVDPPPLLVEKVGFLMISCDILLEN